MFDALFEMFQSNPPRAAAVTVAMVVVLGLLLWVSVIDVRKRSITFWKMLIASGSIIAAPLLVSLFYSCERLGSLKWFMMAAIPLWFFFLYLNVKINKDKFMGKADIDLLSAIFAVGICYSIWLSRVVEAEAVTIRITAFWYRSLGFLLLGALVYLAIFVVLVFARVVTKKQTLKELVKSTKISIIPMFMPVSVMVPYMILMT